MVISPEPCGTPGAVYRKVLPSIAFRKPKNQYAGNCCICGQHVPAGKGGVEKDSKTGKWNVMC